MKGRAPASAARVPVVIVGLDCPTGLQAARIFRARGIDVIGIAANPRHPCARTRACNRLVVAEPGDEGGVAALQALTSSLDNRAVLVPCTDVAVLEAARHGASLAAAYHVALPSPEVIELLLDKARFAEFAAARGLPIPVTRVLRARADAEEAAHALRFPCVLKPSLKTSRWEEHVSAKALVARSPTSLLLLYEQNAPWCDALVAQEWIRGGDTDHYTCDCYLDATGVPLVTFSARKLRQWPPQVGQGCLSVECRNDVVRDEALRLFHEAGHRGLGYLEMKQDASSGRHLIVEANVGRPTGRSCAAEVAGVEFLMTMYCDLVGEPLPSERVQHFEGVRWIYLRRDLQACLRLWWDRHATARELMRPWKGRFAFAMFSARDPMPFLADLAQTAVRGVRGGERALEAPIPASGDGSTLAAPIVRLTDSVRPLASTRRPATSLGPRARPEADFDLGGILTVRAEGLARADTDTVARALGPPLPVGPERPDVVVRFVKALAAPSLRLVDGGRLGYGADGLYFLRTPHGRPYARLRFGDRWTEDVIVCESGAPRVPGLAAVVDLATLARGWIPLHASAWIQGGVGVVAAGWARSGKTGALLAFHEAGAQAVGDDRVFLSRDGRSMVGLGGAIEVRDWHLTQLRALGTKCGAARRAVARTTVRMDAVAARLAGSRLSGPRTWERPLRKVLAAVSRRAGFELAPGALTGAGTGPQPGPHIVIALETRRDGELRCERVDASTMAAKLAAMTCVETLPALQTQLAFQYAFPDGGRHGAEAIPMMITEMLHDALEGKATYVVSHPYPCSLEALRQTIVEVVPPHRPAASDTREPRPITRAPFPSPVSRAPWRNVSSARKETP